MKAKVRKKTIKNFKRKQKGAGYDVRICKSNLLCFGNSIRRNSKQ